MNKKIYQFRLRIIKRRKNRNRNMRRMILFLTMLGQVGKVMQAVRENPRRGGQVRTIQKKMIRLLKCLMKMRSMIMMLKKISRNKKSKKYSVIEELLLAHRCMLLLKCWMQVLVAHLQISGLLEL